MYVCNCNGINEKAIKSQVMKSGTSAICELKKECGLGDGCGMCIKHAQNVMKACQKDCQ